jgi:methylmalonyl-CoA mutase C-terminal domain/subunit
VRPESRGRILVAKVGLDGHDRGVKVVARILRDAGFEVLYTGLRQSPDMVAAAAAQEDVDAVGISILSGGHLALVPDVIAALRARDVDVPVIVGGIIPPQDVDVLLAAGVAEILGPGAPAAAVIDAFASRVVRSFGGTPS